MAKLEGRWTVSILYSLYDTLEEAWCESGRQYDVLRRELERLMRVYPKYSDALIDYADELLESEDAQ